MEATQEIRAYSAELREDQWDLIVMALEHVRLMTQSGASAYAVDTVGRRFLQRCVKEIVTDIRAQVPANDK